MRKAIACCLILASLTACTSTTPHPRVSSAAFCIAARAIKDENATPVTSSPDRAQAESRLARQLTALYTAADRAEREGWNPTPPLSRTSIGHVSLTLTHDCGLDTSIFGTTG